MGAFLDGRVTYELMADFWPTADTDPSSPAPMVEFARIWRDTPKIVFSRTFDRADWNTTVVRELVVEEIMDLKAQPGGDLAPGGADLAASFMAPRPDRRVPALRPPGHHRGGQAMFKPSDATIDLRLAESRTFGNGVVLLRYQRGED